MNIKEGDKLYIVVRQDIAPGLQIAQSCHVSFSFMSEHANEAMSWMEISNYIAVLGAANEKELYGLICRAKDTNIKLSVFREPDINNEITAIALECSSESKTLVQNLKLALKGK